jgi:hypothetical protein
MIKNTGIKSVDVNW